MLVGRRCLGIIELYARTRAPTTTSCARASPPSAGSSASSRTGAGREALQARERFRALVENGSDVTALVDADGRIKYASGPVRGSGPLSGKLVGQTSCIGGRGRDAAAQPPWPAPGQPVTATYRLQHRDGTWRVLESIVVSHQTTRPSRHRRNARDVSERHLLEEQLRQSQKMEAVGRLAGGIAHDFNNLLAVIVGYTTLTLARATDPAAVTRNLEQIRTAAERAANLTRQLLTFSRKQVLQPKVIDIAGVVSELDSMLERLIGEDVELVTEVGRAKGHVKADRGQLEQVIVNLAVNARDAMPRGGRLGIVMRNVVVDAALAREQPGLGPGRHVRIEVSHNGVGMAPETLSRLFEPFFSTRGRAGHRARPGHGLRDRQAERRARRGRARPGAAPPSRIWLPEVEVETPAAPPRERPRPRIETSSSSRQAGRGAHEVLAERVQGAQASSGAEALRGRARPVDLLLTDVVMPGMGGAGGHRPCGAAGTACALRIGLHRGGHCPPASWAGTDSSTSPSRRTLLRRVPEGGQAVVIF